MYHLALITLTLTLLAGCGGERQSQIKQIDRAQKRSLNWRYGKLMASPAGRTLADKVAHSAVHAQTQAVTLAKEVKEVEGDVNLYSAVGLTDRAKRRYNTMLNYTKRRVASGALNPTAHTRL